MNKACGDKLTPKFETKAVPEVEPNLKNFNNTDITHTWTLNHKKTTMIGYLGEQKYYLLLPVYILLTC